MQKNYETNSRFFRNKSGDELKEDPEDLFSRSGKRASMHGDIQACMVTYKRAW